MGALAAAHGHPQLLGGTGKPRLAGHRQARGSLVLPQCKSSSGRMARTPSLGLLQWRVYPWKHRVKIQLVHWGLPFAPPSKSNLDQDLH